MENPGFREYFKSNIKKVFGLSAFIILMLIVLVIANIKDFRENFLIRDGNIIAVKENSGVVSLILNKYGDEEIDEKFMLDTRAIEKEYNRKENELDEKENHLISLFNQVKTSDEYRKNGFILLPDKLSDGKSLKWTARIDWSFLYLILIVPLFVSLDYRSRKNKNKIRRDEINGSITRSLPGFNNSLILLLESGLIFEDAFYRIVMSYEKKNYKSFFEKFIIDVKENAALTGRDYVTVLNADAMKVKNRDLSRLGSVFADNRNKGVSFSEKLLNESEYLWEERKKYAAEKSKKAEIRMALPLGILLLALILITASPAILQI